MVIKKGTLSKTSSILGLLLEGMQKNLTKALNDAEEQGIITHVPGSVSVSVPVDLSGLPCKYEEATTVLHLDLVIDNTPPWER